LLYATCKRDANIISVMDSITGKTHDYSLGEIKSNGLRVYGVLSNSVRYYSSMSQIVDMYMMRQKLVGSCKFNIEFVKDAEKYSGEGISTLKVYTGCDSCVVVPDIVEKLGAFLFSENTIVKVIKLHEGIIEIGVCCFERCTALESVHIPDSVKFIGSYAFSYAHISEVRLPSSLAVIAKGSFRGCSLLRHVNIPDSVTKIAVRAFQKSGLESINFPSSLVTIEMEAFLGCEKLRSIRLPDGIKYLHKGCFSQCTSLTKVELPNSLLIIESEAFCYCNIMSIRLPKNVKLIDLGGLENCYGLMEIRVSHNAVCANDLRNSDVLSEYIIWEDE